ncbi:MAG: PEP-CTERM sorting domain-containing protein [Mitsuaria chitosanitabida]|jgi:hypothetical protein|uniref:PEP-CTERM sorting domain-containing protein n=1 Tax=Roseateles chitosanitabidus TaxID=65048 RepID=UPI001B20A233|nr:PEP-CTERM sorting domain-containing protein [Roseateles chitosanitabidus]MBO9685534.1 PEP-CTERM sorting domain-containing protein [Roseateles chitosanitabidus]
MITTRLVKSLAAAGLALALGSAQASPVTFNLSYSGLSFGNEAVATGFITLESDSFTHATNVGNVSPAALGITAFQITVNGAAGGNGTFQLSDFGAAPNGWVLNVSQPLNLGLDLVGQIGFNDFNWCAISAACGSASAPGGNAIFTIRTAAETGDQLRLTSMAVANVPEPGSLALLGIAVAGLAAVRRRKQ